jgi:hypothetical protein
MPDANLDLEPDQKLMPKLDPDPKAMLNPDPSPKKNNFGSTTHWISVAVGFIFVSMK